MTLRLMIWMIAILLPAQVAEQANSGYRTPEARSQVAESLGKESRIEDLKPTELIAAIGIKPGMTVVDLGTGIGAFLPYLSEAVGPQGRVIAEDIFPDFLEKAKQRARDKGLKNVEFVLGSDADPKLPAGAADVVLTIDVYHHFDYPDKMLAAIGKALKPGGRFVITDMHKSATAMPNGRALQHIRLSADDVVKEVESNGWRLITRREHAPGRLWVGIFTRN